VGTAGSRARTREDVREREPRGDPSRVPAKPVSPPSGIASAPRAYCSVVDEGQGVSEREGLAGEPPFCGASFTPLAGCVSQPGPGAM
jgi:hypothetical protein